MEVANKKLTEQREGLQDSIKQLLSRPNFSGFPVGLRIDTSRGYFGKLYLDTLVLGAQFSECGEWGGHREWLKIYMDQRNITKAIFIKDSVVCRFKNQGKKYFRVENSVFTIEKNLQQEISNYLLDLNRMTFMEQVMYANAANSYSANIKSGAGGIPKLFNYNISFYDLSFKWDHFERLRDKIKKGSK